MSQHRSVPDLSDPQTGSSRRREGKFAGIRLVGVFVPWQAVALTLTLVVALTGVAVARWGGGGGTVRVEQSSSEAALGDATTSSTTTTTAVAVTAATAPTTTTAPKPTTTTAPPTTTTTSLQPGFAEVLVFSGEQGDGPCQIPETDWGFFGCPDQGMRPEFTFNLDTRRYHPSARFHVDLAVSVRHDVTYCIRVFDLDRNGPVAGSESCWTTPVVPPPPPYQSYPPDPSFVSEVGPVSFPVGAGHYVLQTKMTRGGQPCQERTCGAQLKRAKVLIEWG